MNFFPPKSLQLTIALIKPHAAKVPPIVEYIKEEILNNKFLVIRFAKCVLNEGSASKMYEEHKGKPFYPPLIGLMTSGPTYSFLLAREKGIETWRKMMGPTRPYDAMFKDESSLRGKFGLSNTRNATHGSDAPKSARRECAIFFPEFNFDDWYEQEEIYYRNGYVKFDEAQFIHLIECDDFSKSIK